jgi:hypothetical protein
LILIGDIGIRSPETINIVCDTWQPRSCSMKNLFYLSLSILCLSISALIGFHVGSTTVHATASKTAIASHVIWEDEVHVILENGDMYRNNVIPRGPAVSVGNFWGGERLRPDQPASQGND